MANDKLVTTLKEVVSSLWLRWNRWRLLSRANRGRANLNLSGASLEAVMLHRANLSGANLSGADLREAILVGANLSGANLSGANLEYAQLVETDFTGADLTGCRVFGISAWRLKLEKAKQQSLVITRLDEPKITVDNIEVRNGRNGSSRRASQYRARFSLSTYPADPAARTS